MSSINELKLEIPSTMWDKVRYFLKSFKGLEWSGPAWFSHVKDENGFPSLVKLEYFHPLHLGTAGETDWDGKELIKVYKPLRKEFPEIGKSWVQGNIHSHHEMGAFFSGTDIQQLEDGANENFYYSLVVSTKTGKETAMAVSYPDQFNRMHVDEFEDIEVEDIQTFDKEWKKQATYIKKNKKPEKNLWNYNYKRGSYNNQLSQGSLFQHTNTKKATRQDRYDDWVDTLSYNGAFTDENDLTYKDWEAYDELMLDYERGRIKKRKLKQELKKLRMDENGYPIPS